MTRGSEVVRHYVRTCIHKKKGGGGGWGVVGGRMIWSCLKKEGSTFQ